MGTILKIHNLRKEYMRGGVPFNAVDNVSLTVENGDFVNIIGRSGSGKSTLLNLTTGMLSPTSGEIELDGLPLAGKSDRELSKIRNSSIGFISQGEPTLPNLTILENVMLPFYLYPRTGDGRGRAELLLERFGIADTADNFPRELSGGELRRALIARALMNRPKLVIADEPTSDLDVESTRAIMEEFARLNEEGVTLLVVSHDLDTLCYGKTVYTMESGRIHEGNLFEKK